MSKRWQPSSWGRHKDRDRDRDSSANSNIASIGHSNIHSGTSTVRESWDTSVSLPLAQGGTPRTNGAFSLFPSSVSTRSGFSSFSRENTNYRDKDDRDRAYEGSRHPTLPTIFDIPSPAEHQQQGGHSQHPSLSSSYPSTLSSGSHTHTHNTSSTLPTPAPLPPTQPLHIPPKSSYPSQSQSHSHPNSHSHSNPRPPQPYTSHPYAAMPPPPQAVISSRVEDEDDCPVCLEPLSFSFRIPGEKPHIVPECGHALHEACFSAVYGPPASRANGTQVRKANLGVCGVCRRPMKVGDGDSSKNNKLAALTGMGEKRASPYTATHLYPGRSDPSPASSSPSLLPSHTHNPSPSQPSRARTPMPAPLGPHDDDPIEPPARRTQQEREGGRERDVYVTTPSIQVRPEFGSMTRNGEKCQPMTVVVVVELPSRRVQGGGGQPMSPQSMNSHSQQGNGHGHGHGNGSDGVRRRDWERERDEQEPLTASSASHHSHNQPWEQANGNGTRSRAPSESQHPMSNSSHSHGTPPSPPPPPSPPAAPTQAFQRITDDLRARILDWKGHELAQLGALCMFDILRVRRDTLVREFYVYLFREAIICVQEERKKVLGRLLGPGDEGGRGPLRLKGRIYIKHIRRVVDTSVQGELSLTVHMDDESFILIFADRGSLDSWRANILGLVNEARTGGEANGNGNGSGVVSRREREFGDDQFPQGVTGKAARMLQGSASANLSDTASASAADDSLLHSSQRSTMSSNLSGAKQASHPQLKQPASDTSLYHAASYPSLSSAAGMTSPGALGVPSGAPSNTLPPLPHPPTDLIAIVSSPPPSALPSTAALKLRVLRTTLDFILAALGPRDRLSLVSFEVGPRGRVRKTPFLSLSKPSSRRRLENFISGLGGEQDEKTDEFLVPPSKEEKTDVVTAVNHGLDVVLQRKAKNPITGIVLVSDAADTMRRAQMDLVLARAEAANVPIHSFGYGRSHDPASLWLMSNHTGGTYTFVRDWYDLRDCIAGCVGGLMSIGLLNVKLHLKAVDGNRFRIRKVSGGPHAIVSSTGKDSDIEVGELRYGERKEMLVELELDNQSDLSNSTNNRGSTFSGADDLRSRQMNATDQYVQRLGLDALSISESGTNLVDGMMERMIDEVPVFEVDGAFFDPVAGKQVSRLVHPVLLTVTLLPYTGRPATPSGPSDPYIVRRRMELLAADMMTRALMLVSRKNFEQAARVLVETKRILHTVLHNVTQSLPPPTSGSAGRSRRELLTMATVRTLQSVLQDIQVLTDALEENKDLFAHDHRNFGAQQAMILRDQKSWTGRTATEKLFWTADSSIDLVGRSSDWVGRD